MTRRSNRSPHGHAGPTRTAAVLLATTLLPTAGCSVFDGGTDVVLLGDSLTVLVVDQVKADAQPDHEVTSDATWGRRIDEQLDVAADIASKDPQQVIINLGTNNVLQRHDPTASVEDLGTLLDALEDVGCIHIVTVNEHIRRLGEDYSLEARAINDGIRTLAERRLDTDIIDWNQIVTDHLADGIISDDTVHPNPAGVDLLAAAYIDAIDSC